MLVVKVEVWPGGNPTARKEIGFVQISNQSDLADVSDYLVRVDGTANEALGIDAMRAGFMIENHPRRQPVWSLLKKVMDKLA